MRIIAGEFKSRKVESLPGDTTRPTLDHVKESFFNRIGPYFEEGLMLDVFGGSGNIAFEFLSRGVSQAVIIERENAAQRVIEKNIEALKLSSRTHLMKMDCFKALKSLHQKFDYVYLDPPYKFEKIGKVMALLKEHLQENAQVYYECDLHKTDLEVEGYQLIRTDSYGPCQIAIYQIKKES